MKACPRALPPPGPLPFGNTQVTHNSISWREPLTDSKTTDKGRGRLDAANSTGDGSQGADVMTIGKLCLLVLATALLTDGPVSIASAAEMATVEIGWKQLMPPLPPRPAAIQSTGPVECCDAPDDDLPPPPMEEGAFMSRKRVDPNPAPTVAALDGQSVKIAGYVVPLDFDGTLVKDFLLVPFVGACVHVPPPPANQIIFITAAQPFEVKSEFDPVYVTGRLEVKPQNTELADTGYAIHAAVVQSR